MRQVKEGPGSLCAHVLCVPYLDRDLCTGITVSKVALLIQKKKYTLPVRLTPHLSVLQGKNADLRSGYVDNNMMNPSYYIAKT